MTLKKNQTSKVEKLFNGSKKVAPVRDARKIADMVGVPRRQVMRFLESNGYRNYSPGSYK